MGEFCDLPENAGCCCIKVSRQKTVDSIASRGTIHSAGSATAFGSLKTERPFATASSDTQKHLEKADKPHKSKVRTSVVDRVDGQVDTHVTRIATVPGRKRMSLV